jgi:nitrogen fixation-related uncharacterized protein
MELAFVPIAIAALVVVAAVLLALMWASGGQFDF